MNPLPLLPKIKYDASLVLFFLKKLIKNIPQGPL